MPETRCLGEEIKLTVSKIVQELTTMGTHSHGLSLAYSTVTKDCPRLLVRIYETELNYIKICPVLILDEYLALLK